MGTFLKGIRVPPGPCAVARSKFNDPFDPPPSSRQPSPTCALNLRRDPLNTLRPFLFALAAPSDGRGEFAISQIH